MSLDPVTGTPEKHRMASVGAPELVSLPLTEEERKGYSLKTAVPTQDGGAELRTPDSCTPKYQSSISFPPLL